MSEESVERLRVLRERGHGECLEAIRLIEDDEARARELRRYVDTRPPGKMLRRAQRLLSNKGGN